VRAARLAIVALLIDALLPTALAAAPHGDPAGPLLPLCRAGTADPLPAKSAPDLPPRHCTLCAVCAMALLPVRPPPIFARRVEETAHPAVVVAASLGTTRHDYAVAQPRAPPTAQL
jgi:hypothetical protein